MIKKILMAATVILLLLAVIITPRLLGRSDVSSFPVVRFTIQDHRLHLLVTSVSGDYLYRGIFLLIDDNSLELVRVETNNTWGERASLLVGDRMVFNLTSVVYDRLLNLYRLNVHFVITREANSWLYNVYSADQDRTCRQLDLSGSTATPCSFIFPRREASSGSG